MGYVVKSKSSLPYYTVEELSQAKNLLKDELMNVLAEVGIPELDDCNAAWDDITRDLFYLPSKQKYMSAAKSKPADMQSFFSHKFDIMRQQMTKDAKKANKVEKRLMTLTMGYEKRSMQLIKEI